MKWNLIFIHDALWVKTVESDVSYKMISMSKYITASNMKAYVKIGPYIKYKYIRMFQAGRTIITIVLYYVSK